MISSESAQNAIEMPKYECHKKVWALKIERIELSKTVEGGALIYPVEKGYAPFEVDLQFMKKHQPQEGGYYVVYQDGYKSFSPAEAFEAGYTLIK